VQKILKKFLLVLGLIFAALFAMGAAIWLAGVRQSEFYLLKSLRGQASLALWLAPPESAANWWGLSPEKLNLSVWISPAKVRAAVRHFDVWIQEYSLLRELTDEAADQEGDGYVLPPSVLPNDEQESEEIFLEDSYDIALRQLVQDFWQSGFIVVAGSVHFRSPLWLKPGLGWLASGAHPQLATAFFDSYLASLGAREDGADLPSWMTEIPFAHLDVLQKDGAALQESVFEVGGEQLASLHVRLCDLGHLPDTWCILDEGTPFAVEALLYATEDFKAQFKVYWQIRGEHLVWSNTPECLSALLGQREVANHTCGEFSAAVEPTKLSLGERDFFKRQSIQKTSMEAGFFLNQHVLYSEFERSHKLLEETPAEGASWLFDALQSSGGLGTVEHWRAELLEQSLLRPRWGSRFVWEPPEAGALSTFVRFTQSPRPVDRLAARWAESQFKFLYGLISSWRGLPRSPGQIEKIEPWQKSESFWNAVARYRLGWSESQ